MICRHELVPLLPERYSHAGVLDLVLRAEAALDFLLGSNPHLRPLLAIGERMQENAEDIGWKFSTERDY